MDVEQCRLCGKDSGLTSVFEEKDLWLKIFMCFGVKVDRGDDVSKKICKSCYFFTNSVYEFRLNSVAHDAKLKLLQSVREEYDATDVSNAEPAIISYPSEISQDDFLNTFNLAHKNETSPKKEFYHPSVLKIKRKFPNINLPEECHEVHIDPVVQVEIPTKLLKLNADNLGIWSVSSRQLQGKDLILTRVRSDQASENDADNESDTIKHESLNPMISPKTNAVRRKKNCPWTTTHRRKRKTKIQKNVLSKKVENKIPPPPTNPLENKIIPPPLPIPEPKPVNSTDIEQEICALNLLIQSDAQLSVTPPPPADDYYSSAGDASPPRPEEYSNLLIAVGEAVPTFFCQTCNKVFDTEAELDNHKKNSHKSSLRCTKCAKRFAIVESLVNHTLTCHPESDFEEIELIKARSLITTQTNQGQMTIETSITNEPQLIIATTITGSQEIGPTRTTVARKRTCAVPFNTISEERRLEIQEFIISSDDDVEITDIIERSEDENSNSATDAVQPTESAGVESEKPATEEPKENEAGDSLLSMMLSNPTVISLEAGTERRIATTEEIMLIDDSDDEIEDTAANKKITKSDTKTTKSGKENSKFKKKNAKSNKKNENSQGGKEKTDIENTKTSTENTFDGETFVIDDDSEAETIPLTRRPRRKNTIYSDSSSSVPSNSTDIDSTPRQQIVVVPSAEDKEHMDASSSVKAKITNELNYVNYVFNKCSYLDKPKNDQKWFLKDVDKFTEKTFLPIELIRTTGEEVYVEYGQTTVEQPANKLPFWDANDAIDFLKRNPKLPVKPSAKQSFEKVFKDYAKKICEEKKNESFLSKKCLYNNKGCKPLITEPVIEPNVVEIDLNPPMFLIENPKAQTMATLQAVSTASTITQSTNTTSDISISSILRSNIPPQASNIQVATTAPSTILRSNIFPQSTNSQVATTATSTITKAGNTSPYIQVISTASPTVSKSATAPPYVQVASSALSTVSKPVTSTPYIQIASTALSTVSKPVTSAPYVQVASTALSTVSKPVTSAPYVQVTSTVSSTVSKSATAAPGFQVVNTSSTVSNPATATHYFQVVSSASSTVSKPATATSYTQVVSPATSTISRPTNTLSTHSTLQATNIVPSSVIRSNNSSPNNSNMQVVSSAPTVSVSAKVFHPPTGTITRISNANSRYQVVNATPLRASRPTNINQVFPRIERPTQYHPQATKKILNFALQNGVNNFNRNPPFVSFLPKTLGPTTSQTDFVEVPQIQSNGYILMGVATQNGMIQPGSENTVFLREVDDSSGAFQINKPIILNGMSYPSVAKIRNPNQTLVVQQVPQQRNVNLQNCFNIGPPDIANSDQIIIEETSNSPPPPVRPAILPLLPTAEITPSSSQATVVASEPSDSTVSTTKPTIRIKNLSELTGDAPNNRDELHNLYSNTLSTYVQNHSSTLTNRANNDEYLQIS